MRFGDFVQEWGVAVSPVDLFAGFVVEVGVPPGWDPFSSGVGVRVWVCRTDPRINDFCANAVLTMHRVGASLDAREVFAMLVDQQMHSVPGCHQRHGELVTATEGAGVVGVLALEIEDEHGTIESVARSRIITAERETLIAQLTVTALRDSPVDRAGVWLTVRTGAATGPFSTGQDGGVPVTAMREGH